MQSTYSFSEIKALIRSLDLPSLKILEDLIEEERDCFTSFELKALHKFFLLKYKDFLVNEVKVEYLLSFN